MYIVCEFDIDEERFIGCTDNLKLAKSLRRKTIRKYFDRYYKNQRDNYLKHNKNLDWYIYMKSTYHRYLNNIRIIEIELNKMYEFPFNKFFDLLIKE